MKFTAIILLSLCFLSSVALAAKQAPILFIIQAQEIAYHQDIALKSKASILDQWKKFVPSHVMDPPKVILTTELEDGKSASAWTLFPLVSEANAMLDEDEELDWVAILNENTEVDLRNLNTAVQKYTFKPKEEALFLGRGVKDESSTIVHHFDNYESSGVVYPDLESGIFLSRKLVRHLDEELKMLEKEWKAGNKDDQFPRDFNIDPSYEFAKFLYKPGYDGRESIPLTHIEEMCPKKSAKPSCITYPRPMNGCLRSKDSEGLLRMLSPSVAKVTVKTCSKFHTERLPVVRDTFGRHLELEYISDEETSEPVPTVRLPFTINTEGGHCNKTMAIIHKFLETPGPEFLVIIDDDTILSAARLASLLSCYQGEEEPLLLGQRYGYSCAVAGQGYSYITGGGGIILNRQAVELLARCPCPQASTPDDMHLGMCARRADMPTVHSNRMFQARPPDYPQSLIAYRKPVSFHKHWEIDPFKVYEDFFAKADKSLKTMKEEL